MLYALIIWVATVKGVAIVNVGYYKTQASCEASGELHLKKNPARMLVERRNYDCIQVEEKE